MQRTARLTDPGACGRSAEAADAQAAAQRREARLDAAGAAVRGREDAAMRAEALLGAEREALTVKHAGSMHTSGCMQRGGICVALTHSCARLGYGLRVWTEAVCFQPLSAHTFSRAHVRPL